MTHKFSHLASAIAGLTLLFQSVVQANAGNEDKNVLADGILSTNDFLGAADAVAEGFGANQPWAKTLKITGPLGDASKAISKVSDRDYAGAIATGFGGRIGGPLIATGAAVGTGVAPGIGTAIGAGVGFLISKALEKYAEASGNAVLRLLDKDKPEIIKRLDAAGIDFRNIANRYNFCSDVEKWQYEIDVRKQLQKREFELSQKQDEPYTPDKFLEQEIFNLQEWLATAKNELREAQERRNSNQAGHDIPFYERLIAQNRNCQSMGVSSIESCNLTYGSIEAHQASIWAIQNPPESQNAMCLPSRRSQ